MCDYMVCKALPTLILFESMANSPAQIKCWTYANDLLVFNVLVILQVMKIIYQIILYSSFKSHEFAV